MSDIVRHSVTMDLFDPQRYAVLERMADTLLQSGMLPSWLKQPAQVITIMLKSFELGVPPIEGLNGISVIQGKPTVSPQLMLALIERSGTGTISIIERRADLSVVEAHRRGRKPVQFAFSFDDAKKLGLANKDNYQKQPAVMLQWRNIGAAARAVFPDVISGLYTPEEMGADVQILEDGSQIIIEVEPQTPTPAAPQDISRVQKGTQQIPALTNEEKNQMVMLKAQILDNYGITERRFEQFMAFMSKNDQWRNAVSTRLILQDFIDNGEVHEDNLSGAFDQFEATHPESTETKGSA
jgi:hypothetical protein